MAIVRNRSVGTWFTTVVRNRVVFLGWASGDGYRADHYTVVVSELNRVVRTSIDFGRRKIGTVLIVLRYCRCTQPIDQDVVCRWASRGWYGADPCTVMAIAPNRVVGSWFAVCHREIRTVLILG